MKRIAGFSSKCVFGCGLALSLCAPLTGAYAQSNTIYAFSGGSDGGNPPCGVISGGKGVFPTAGSLYGTTEYGGDGSGTVFSVPAQGHSDNVLYRFSGGSDGAYPVASLIMDASHNLYGTTEAGGLHGFGVVFRLTPGGSETPLYSFAGGSDGAQPAASLIMDGAGNLYGTTAAGGTSGLGTVFEVAPNGSETLLHSFTGKDGAVPLASLIMDTNHNLYGTTSEGGSSKNCKSGCGTIFKLSPAGSETVLHSFVGKDGAIPLAALIMDKAGNVYSTTEAGGSHGEGTVFKFSASGRETVLHSFAGGNNDGANPVAGVIEKLGYLYGTTSMGGVNDQGTVFKTPVRAGSDTVLYSFKGGSDGGLPEGGVINVGGNLFGTTFAGGNTGSCFNGNGCGVVFEIAP